MPKKMSNTSKQSDKKLIIISHESAVKHIVPLGHPERPERFVAINEIIKDQFSHLKTFNAPQIDYETLCLVHNKNYLDKIFKLSQNKSLLKLDSDTWFGQHSLEVSLRSAGSACLGIDKIFQNYTKIAFSSMRPPGHHAEPDRAMGFCIFSNAAIAAKYACQKYGIEKVAVIDFDVHHGNGTQKAFWNNKNLMYVSSHQMPLFPGTGKKDEIGVGNVFNLPLSEGTDGKKFLKLWKSYLLPKVKQFEPELIIISAGFDAHKNDPLGGLNLNSKDFYDLTLEIKNISEKKSNGRILTILEGGYNLKALKKSVFNHIKCLVN